MRSTDSGGSVGLVCSTSEQAVVGRDTSVTLCLHFAQVVDDVKCFSEHIISPWHCSKYSICSNRSLY